MPARRTTLQYSHIGCTLLRTFTNNLGVADKPPRLMDLGHLFKDDASSDFSRFIASAGSLEAVTARPTTM